MLTPAMPRKLGRRRSHRSKKPGGKPGAAQQTLSVIASGLNLTEAQRSDLQHHDLPGLLMNPAKALWIVSFGGTHLLLYSTASGAKIAQYHAEQGARFYAVEGERARELTAAQARSYQQQLPPSFTLVRRQSPNVIRIEVDGAGDAEGCAVWPDDPLYAAAEELLDVPPGEDAGDKAHWVHDAAQLYEKVRRAAS